MSERAKLPVIALARTTKIRRAEFSLVFVWVVKLLYSIVCLVTSFCVRAFLVVIYVPTFFRLVKTQRSPAILLIVMIERAFLEVMPLGI
jgi:hypothetical protein